MAEGAGAERMVAMDRGSAGSRRVMDDRRSLRSATASECSEGVPGWEDAGEAVLGMGLTANRLLA